MAGKKRTLKDLARLSHRELEEIFRNGKAPDPDYAFFLHHRKGPKIANRG